MDLQKISHYQIIGPLGAGGMGAVFLAEDTKLDRRVAIKFLPAALSSDEKAKTQLICEARSAARLDHPNICCIYEVIEEEPACIVMEYVEGETLSDKIRRHPLMTKEALALVIQVAGALEEVHSCGMIHRDIKPDNVVVTPRGRVKLLDFGLAKMVQQPLGETEKTAGQRPVTKAGSIVGTVAYMCPEQATGGPVGPRSDIFSLGTVLYECLTGMRPFCGATAMEVGANVIFANPPPPSDFKRGVPSELDRIILRMLEKKPEARYQSAGKLIEDLRRVHDSLPEEEFGHVPGNCQESTDLNTTVSTVLLKKLRRPFAFPTAFFNRACNRIGQALSLIL